MLTRIVVLSSVLGMTLALTINDLSELPMDENNHLKNHWFLSSPGCDGLLKTVTHSEHLVQRKSAKMSDEVAANFAEMYSPCIAVTLEKGTPAYTIQNVMPENIFTGINGFSDWLQARRKAEVGFMHFYENPMTVNWVNAAGKRIKLATIESGERNTFWTQSFLGHKFECMDSVTGESLGTYLVEQNSFFVLGMPCSKIVYCAF